MKVVLLQVQGQEQARRETVEPTKASFHSEPQGKRERNCTGDLGMTPGHRHEDPCSFGRS
jgi:hypothetical protein